MHWLFPFFCDNAWTSFVIWVETEGTVTHKELIRYSKFFFRMDAQWTVYGYFLLKCHILVIDFVRLFFERHTRVFRTLSKWQNEYDFKTGWSAFCKFTFYFRPICNIENRGYDGGRLGVRRSLSMSLAANYTGLEKSCCRS